MSHPIVAATCAIHSALMSVGDANPVFMDTADKANALRDLARLEGQMVELWLRIMAAGSDVADATAARDIASWYAAAAHVRAEDARRDGRLARALAEELDGVARGLREGAVSEPQAHVIAHALAQLPDEVGPEVRSRAEHHLVAKAADFGPKELARIGRKILEVVAPEVADAAEVRRLLELEQEGRRQARLTLRRQGDGTTRISGVLPDASAGRLLTYLQAFASPRQHAGDGGGTSGDAFTRVPHPRKLGRALIEFLETVDSSRLPLHGGDATTVVVTLPLADLREGLATADVLSEVHVPGDVDDLGGAAESLSAGEVRRLACNAHVIPAVLGGACEVLDLGRRQRLFSPAQRRALLLRDRICRAEGCDIPGAWAEAHHWIPWHRGGRTDLADGALLCGHHHHRAHDEGYAVERLANGDVRFRRRR